MVQAFGDVSLLCLGMMFPEPHDLIPLDDASFESHLSEFVFKFAHLFSGIKTAVSKPRINQGTPLTVESLQVYHSNFCKALVPFFEEIALQNKS